MVEKIKETKEKILDALQDKKTFVLRWAETVWYEKIVEASSEEKAREMFYDCEIEIDSNKDIVDGEMVDDSLEIEEWHNG